MVFVADDLAAWLVSMFADAGRKKLVTFAAGTDQERALRSAATAAVQRTAKELCPDDEERAEYVARLISQVFSEPAPGALLAGRGTVLEALRAGVAGQLAVLDDAVVTGTGQSSADVLGFPAAVLEEVLTSNLQREIKIRGAHGGALTALASQLNHDVTHLQGQRLESMLDQLRQAMVNVPQATVPAVRSAYLHQVHALAPHNLLDREKELAELADFCTGSGSGSYLWWRAGAWSGKTALMSWFVLNPPPETCVVSFFVTARYAAQNERGAFLEVIIEQLATLLGEPLPPILTSATGPAHMWRMLQDAAARCSELGQRLVLVVDGLDEDRGIAEHSIAALLPAQPLGGMRVVVTSRHDPPLPGDVPSGHPLLDPAVQRFLASSPHAQVIRHEANTGLIQLVEGPALGQDLLGFVVAAGGGLSSRDLVELTRHPDWAIKRVFASAVGRAFTRRPAINQSGPLSTRDVYLLSHEELQEKAEEFLGATLAEYREQLRTWADTYRQQGWPGDTPEYLLRGYFRMLHADGDLSGMVGCALDHARHDRMVAVTGGDAAALAEIAATQEFILDCDAPDLRAMALLAVRGHALTQRNSNVPVDLPAVWVHLRQPLRAETQARSISDPAAQLRATASVIRALAETGNHGRARDLATGLVPRAMAFSRQGRPNQETLEAVAVTLASADCGTQAEQLARTVITGVKQQSWALWKVAKALAEAGEAEDAERVARSITEDASQQAALERVARALVKQGNVHRATMVARAITGAHQLASVAQAFAEVGEADRAESIARSITEHTLQAHVLAGVARGLAETGRVEAAEGIAHTITHASNREWALAGVALALAKGSKPDRAMAVAQAIAEPPRRVQMMAELARIFIILGEITDAKTAASEAATAAKAITSAGDRAKALSEAMRAWAAAGETGFAQDIAQTLMNANLRAQALTDIARIAAEAGHTENANEAARQAEAAADSLTDSHARSLALTQVARAWAAAGEAAHAEHLAKSVTLPRGRAWALADVARAWAHKGAVDHAKTIAQSIGESAWRVRAFVDLARAWVKDTDHAQEVVRETDTVMREAEVNDGESGYPSDRSWPKLALVRVAQALEKVGERDRADELAEEAENWARREPFDRLQVMAATARALAEAGMADRAEALARDTETAARMEVDPDQQAQTLLAVAQALAKAGEVDRADELARAAKDLARRIVMASQQSELLVDVALVRSGVWADAGRTDRAMELALEAEANAQALDDGFEMWSERWARVALALAKAGDADRAEQFAQGITDPEYQLEALVGCVDAWLEKGKIDRGEAVVRRMPDSVRFGGMAHLIRTLAATGHAGRTKALARDAEAAAQNVSGPDVQPGLLADLARALAEVGETGRAGAVVRKSASMIQNSATLDEWEHVMDMTDVAWALAEVGEADHAEAMLRRAHAEAEGIPDQFLQSSALMDITYAYAHIGEVDRAERLANSITDPHAGPGALVNVARAWARAGEVDRAEAIADGIASPDAKAQVLVDLIPYVGPAHAQRLVAQALRPGGWQRALSALAGIRPDVLSEVADALSNDGNGLS